jgi:hypothetical protein
MLSMRLMLEPYEYEWNKLINITHVEAGSNSSTVTLRVLGDNEKGRLKSETVKYGRES